ncbi:SNF2 family N-terminal domain-domain-containing protein [Clohesyomyces aquaticus]|uniref:SNF2 family N-terminal domain-domain-containing protein n=1 Tax=Clohesyomyces aquaticus TaxID=1231657 RepID=A0A1Y1ZE06_9PLEO|nr:SNF2 family N-terminal domain-domain-containing protein [Clohesyomyces aquaticus]
MSRSPRKHRGPFRPINTLSSPQKPTFAQARQERPSATPNNTSRAENTRDTYKDLPGLDRLPSDSPASFGGDFSETDLLGNSSSLSDEAHVDCPQYTASRSKYAPNPARLNNGTSAKEPDKMVKEREPPVPVHRTEPPLPKALQDPTHKSPEFGKTSPIRNPLKNDVPKDQYSHLFNVPKPGNARPEHHRPSQPAPHQPSFAPTRNGIPGAGQQRVPSLGQAPPLYNSGAALPPHPFKRDHAQPTARYSTASSTGSDLVEIPAAQFQPRQPSYGVPIPRPANPPNRTVQPAARPMFSTMDANTRFQPVNHGFNPVNPFHGSRQTVILDDLPRRRSDNEGDDFDPDAELRAQGTKFGDPDLYAYVDQNKANENIKALFEGGLEADEKIPRMRGRKKRKQEEEKAAKTLAEKLQALDVKDKKEEEEAEDDDEEDDGTVEGMKIKLLPHQVDGVAWMIEKETGAHNKRAKLTKGGILADDMGLGKTVQSIAVILSNPRPDKDVEPENKKNKILPSVGKGTLIVAPLALIKQWEAEINTKVTREHALKVLVHHGPNRTKSFDKLKTYDVVVTTYQVLSSEHASCGEGPNGLKKGCFGVNWYRVILDEAHTIKNRNAKMTKACYDLRAHYRWCLTGTPMQNNLDELQSLIKFLGIEPYATLSNWKESITGPMKNGRGNLAMKRLQIFLGRLMKRRTKDVLKKEGALNFGGKAKAGEEKQSFQIVARNVENVIGSFTHKEREFYDRLSNRAESRLAEMMGGAKTDYIGALVLLLRLRQACNHPNLTKSNVKDDKDALTTGSKPTTQTGTQTPRKGQADDADDLADLFGGLSVQTKRCDVCQLKMTKENAAPGAIRCNECENDLNASQKKVKKHKKHRKHGKNKKDKSKSKNNHKSKEEGEEKPQASKTQRQRRVILDSDDEEEAEGEWIVPEGQQKVTDLGKAGGTDDENAEGGGDSLGSEDSDSFATEDEGTPSKKKGDSFIVHDTDSEDEGPVIRNKSKKSKVISLIDDESGSEADSEEQDSDSDSPTDLEADSDASSSNSDISYTASHLTPSTKIRQLLQILEKETRDHKVIVFSQFTSMLDLIEPFLRREGFSFTRYDGSMRNDLREASLHKLRNDKRTRVLLCSLKCGSLGLNLTAASRVVIMEPFWNPFVEEQAIDRVHRLNQTVDVTVYRLSIHNSVEERILELQDAKRKLAEAAIEGGKAIGKLGMDDILKLFNRNAEYEVGNVDDGSERAIFETRRVLEGGGGVSTEEGERRRKAGSTGLGFKRVEDSVWGRR